MEWGGIDIAIGKSKSSSYTTIATVNDQGMLMSMHSFRPSYDFLDDRLRELFTWLTETIMDGALKNVEINRFHIAQPFIVPMRITAKKPGQKDAYYTNRSQVDLAQARGAVSMVVGAYAPVYEPVETKVNADIIGRGHPSHAEIIAWAANACAGDELQMRRVTASTVNEREDRANAFKMARYAFLDYDYEKKAEAAA